jgi:hypothetical protein
MHPCIHASMHPCIPEEPHTKLPTYPTVSLILVNFSDKEQADNMEKEMEIARTERPREGCGYVWIIHDDK